MNFADVVHRRRMVRQFEDAPVAREVLERIAAIAQRAPSAGFSQGQRLLVITEEVMRRRVAAIVGEQFYVADGFGSWISRCAAQFLPCVSERIYKERYREPDKVAQEARYHEAVGDAAGAGDEEWAIPYWWMDAGCTVMLLLLAVVDEGLAAGFCGVDDPSALQAVLGIPEDMIPVGVIPVGRPRPDKRSPSLSRGRVDFPEFLRWQRW
jgi:nitroreductase